MPCDCCFASCLLKKDSYTKLEEVSMKGSALLPSPESLLLLEKELRAGATYSALLVREVVSDVELSSQSVRASRRIHPPLDTTSESKLGIALYE